MTRYKLSEICKIVSGSTPKTNVPEYWDGENVWITPAEITDKTFIVYDSQRKLSNLGVENTFEFFSKRNSYTFLTCSYW